MTSLFKLCRECGLEYKISQFYVHARMADGYLNKCKKCVKLRVRKHRARNIEKVREHDNARALKPHRVEAAKQYLKWYRKSNPQRYKAQTALGNAVRDGKVIKAISCEKCGSIKNIEGHHKDYDTPLDVVWLCSICHKHVHFNCYKESA